MSDDDFSMFGDEEFEAELDSIVNNDDEFETEEPEFETGEPEFETEPEFNPEPEFVHEEPPEFVTESPLVEDETIYDGNILLMLAIVCLAIAHEVSDIFINAMVSISCPPSNQEQIILDEINELRKELSTISQTNEFARHSKVERKIMRARLSLDEYNKFRTTARLQARSAFVTVWRIVAAFIAVTLMWSYSDQPVIRFPDSWWTPLGWFISLPTGLPGAVGIPFFSLAIKSVISSFVKSLKSTKNSS